MSNSMTIVLVSLTSPTEEVNFVEGTSVERPCIARFSEVESGLSFDMPLTEEQHELMLDVLSQLVGNKTTKADEREKAVQNANRKEEVVPSPERRSVASVPSPAPVSSFMSVDSDGPGSAEEAKEPQNWGRAI